MIDKELSKACQGYTTLWLVHFSVTKSSLLKSLHLGILGGAEMVPRHVQPHVRLMLPAAWMPHLGRVLLELTCDNGSDVLGEVDARWVSPPRPRPSVPMQLLLLLSVSGFGDALERLDEAQPPLVAKSKEIFPKKLLPNFWRKQTVWLRVWSLFFLLISGNRRHFRSKNFKLSLLLNHFSPLVNSLGLPTQIIANEALMRSLEVGSEFYVASGRFLKCRHSRDFPIPMRNMTKATGFPLPPLRSWNVTPLAQLLLSPLIYSVPGQCVAALLGFTVCACSPGLAHCCIFKPNIVY